MAYLGFCEGGARTKDARFEAPEAPMGWSVGIGVSPPHWRRGLGRGLCPLPKNFKIFFGLMCSKNFCVQAKGGGASPSAPPLNTPLDTGPWLYRACIASRGKKPHGPVKYRTPGNPIGLPEVPQVCNALEEDRATPPCLQVTGTKFGEDWTKSSENMLADRHSDRHARHNTPPL